MTTLREMSADELARIAEIDRSERITQQYKWREGNLELHDVDIDAPRWGEPGEHSVRYYVDSWRPLIEAGGVLLGAFDRDRLLGFAVYDPSRPRSGANLAVLHVSREYRGRGIGGMLTDAVVRLAREAGKPRLCVSATPTRGTVDFYRGRGFEPLAEPDAELFALEPDDIHLELRL